MDDLARMREEVERLYRVAGEALVKASQLDEVYRKALLKRYPAVAKPEIAER